MQDTPPAPLRLLVADDNPVVRAGLTALLSGRTDTTVVAEATDGQEAYEAAVRHRPDVILLDVRMPGVDGISALPHLVRLAPVMMLTYSHETETVREALRLGAGGYLVHGEFTTEQLVRAVRDVREGRPHVTPGAAQALLGLLHTGASAHAEPQLPPILRESTPQRLSQLQPSMGQSSHSRSRFRYQLSTREAEIMDLIASGMTNQQIAAACFISEKTVKNHINRIFAKLQSTTRSQAAAKWLGVA
ncbi:response regulator [Streptomyces camelliae]|uniref:Response regulator transcription factor n=1 Tax=Streptomyces camelliae TaxID=3004093 RepID=A0ABY7P0U9_9ACTN|nr:response regulator transcription factor [Streptomyces sp. HUAS 2-6]WBO64134.1 response regulator transcription factor [Streptomyces sp. HUAS 2-6]